jgi:hypothetical protein
MSKHKQLIIICLLALAVTQVSIPEIRAATPGTRVRIEPADLVVDLNETFVVQVVIEEAGDLGAFQFDVTYGPSIVQVTEAVLGDFLGSTGRSMVPIGPEVNNAEGKVTLGAISLGSAAGPSGTGVCGRCRYWTRRSVLSGSRWKAARSWWGTQRRRRPQPHPSLCRRVHPKQRTRPPRPRFPRRPHWPLHLCRRQQALRAELRSV